VNLVWFSEIKWTYLTTRKQLLLRQFPPEDQILFFQPFSFVGANSFRPRRDGNITYITLPTYRQTSNRVVNWFFETGFTRGLIMAILRLYVRMLVAVLLRSRVDRVMCSNIFYLDLIRAVKAPYGWDYNDDPEQFGSQPEWAMVKMADFLRDPVHPLTTCSTYLKRELEKRYQREVIHIPNGIDLEAFPPKTNDRARGIFGYVGIISAWFFDFDLVHALANAFPDKRVVLVGPVDADAEPLLRNLLQRPNVIHEPAVPYELLQERMARFEIGLIPLKDIPQVWQAASAKFLQYLATGIPVVSTWMEQFEHFNEHVRLVHGEQAFLQAVSDLQDQPPFDPPAELRAYDWPELSRQFRSTLEQM